ncbi:MAG: NAD(P)H-quinone oxidoreductase [Hyphomonadaceae bacterium]|nr:NAD(P)H-quinone oxidoreductase [Hyphomonadaceae bacterium]
MAETMLAIATTPDEPLSLQAIARPEPGPEEVVIDMRAAGLNRADLLQRKGMYPPPPGAPETMGLECAGVIAEVGKGVTRWKVGDRVCALLGGGGYAEAVVVDEGSLLPLPDGMDFVQGACLAEAMMTVYANVFQRCGLAEGETFLCQGGTSGIGVMAIQMAKLAGAGLILSTAGSAEKCALIAQLGADVAVNYREEDFAEVAKARGGVDVVLDMVGGDYVAKHLEIIKVNGRICNIAYQNGPVVELNLMRLMLKRGILTGTTLRARTAAEKRDIRDAVERQFWEHVEAGRIRTIVDSTFPLAEAEAAHARMSAGGHIGKIVLTRDA